MAERVAGRQRGGYCFMLVGAFAALLHSLGYRVTLHSSAVCDLPPAPCLRTDMFFRFFLFF